MEEARGRRIHPAEKATPDGRSALGRLGIGILLALLLLDPAHALACPCPAGPEHGCPRTGVPASCCDAGKLTGAPGGARAVRVAATPCSCTSGFAQAPWSTPDEPAWRSLGSDPGPVARTSGGPGEVLALRPAARRTSDAHASLASERRYLALGILLI